MKILFRNSQEVNEEYNIAKDILGSGLVNYRTEILENELVIGRYSALPFYEELEKELALKGSRLVNSYVQHLYIADIKNYYEDLKEFTPRTYFLWYNLPDGSYVVKGRTNSRKFQWDKQMFARTNVDVISIVSRLLDDSLIRDQGVCVRKYVPLRTYDIGINGLPITNEWRCFCYQEKLLSYGYYWSNFPDKKPYDELPKEALELLGKIMNIASKKTNFYVVDLAETEDGKWIMIELNDGQMSGLSEIDPEVFYKKLKEEID
ncbi:MAG: ATP-grasp domain-containing protein [Actinomycetota bacterium]